MISVLCVSDCLIDFRLLAGFDHAGEADRLELYWEPSMKNLVLSAFLGGLICAGGFPSSSAIAQGASLADGGQQRQAETDRLVGTWSLTDNNNVLFNLVLNADGTSLTVIGQRHPQEGTPQRLHRDQLVEQGRWSRWGNGIRSDYPSGWSTPFRLVLRDLCNGLGRLGLISTPVPPTTAKRCGCKVQ